MDVAHRLGQTAKEFCICPTYRTFLPAKHPRNRILPENSQLCSAFSGLERNLTLPDSDATSAGGASSDGYASIAAPGPAIVRPLPTRRAGSDAFWPKTGCAWSMAA